MSLHTLRTTLTSDFRANWPKSTHWRRATCAEVDCPQYLMGWVTKVIVGSDMEGYVKADKTRKYKVVNQGEINEYYFEAGQQCFRGEAGVHYKKLERGPVLRKGRRILEADRWIDEFNEQSYRHNIRR